MMNRTGFRPIHKITLLTLINTGIQCATTPINLVLIGGGRDVVKKQV
jgi:hypothetical protein